MNWYVVEALKTYRVVEEFDTFPLEVDQSFSIFEAPDEASAKKDANEDFEDYAKGCSETLTVNDKNGCINYEGIRSILGYGGSQPKHGDEIGYRIFSLKDESTFAELIDPDEDVLLNYFGLGHSCDWSPANKAMQTPDSDGPQENWRGAHILYRLVPMEVRSSYTDILVVESIRLIATADPDAAFALIERDFSQTFLVNLDGLAYEARYAGVRQLIDVSHAAIPIDDQHGHPGTKSEITYSSLEVSTATDLDKLLKGEDVELWYLHT